MKQYDHSIQINPNDFEEILEGRKKFEILPYYDYLEKGQDILVKEIDSTRWIHIQVTYILPKESDSLVPPELTIFSFVRVRHGDS